MVYIIALTYQQAIYALGHQDPPLSRIDIVKACVLSTTAKSDAVSKLRGQEITANDRVIFVGNYYEGPYSLDVQEELIRSGWKPLV